METKDVIVRLRNQNNMTQEELAEKVFVTRQAVSRWETGETTPNIEALKQLSAIFNVSINTLLGSEKKLVCQCCGMELDDSIMSREKDGTINQDYCQWCYTEGKFAYTDLDSLTDFLVEHMAGGPWSPEQARAYYNEFLPQLNHWKKP